MAASAYPSLRYADADAAIDSDCGSRDFTLRDPEGNLWALGTYRPHG